MDREALVRRNTSMAEAYHKIPLRHYIRRGLLHMGAYIPFPSSRIPEHPRILLIRPDHLGDMLLTTPAIRALSNALPSAEIHMLVGPWSADILANYPEIDAILTLPFPGFSRSPKPNLPSPYQLAWKSSRQLRQIGYSTAIILRPDHWWGAMVAAMAGIPQRVGYNLPDTAPFLTEPIPFKHQHAVEQNLRLVAQWTDNVSREKTHYQFTVDDELDRAYISAYLREWNISPTTPIFCIHPGSGTKVKQWEIDKWVTVADTLSEQFGARAVFTGGDHEVAIARSIAEKMSQEACVIAGETDVYQLAALFERSIVVIGPDSGPLHLAVAVETPTVALFGPADPVEFGPWGPPEKHAMLTTNIGCRPCRIIDWTGDDPENHPCVREITVGQVLDAARRVANRSNLV